MGVGASGEEIVVAEVLRSQCVVLCTGVSFVSDWHCHVGGWEGSINGKKEQRVGGVTWGLFKDEFPFFVE